MIGAVEQEEVLQSPSKDQVNERTNSRIKMHSFLTSVRHTSLSSQSGPLQADPAGEEILELLKSTAHDLRGALVSVGAGLKLVEKGYFGQMDQGVAKEINKLKGHIAALTGMLEDSLGRAFSLSEGVIAGFEQLNLKADVLDPVIAELSNEMEQRCALFHNGLGSIPPAMLSLRGDRFWLKVIFRNLLGNALKYGGKGLELAVDLCSRADLLLVDVYNSGKPIPEEHRPFLFERLKTFRAGEGVKSQGLGLGLHLVKQAVARHGGVIRYEVKGEGSNFVLTLPKHAI